MPFNILLVTVFSMVLITLMPKEIYFPGLFICHEQPFALWIFMMTFDIVMTAVAILPSTAIHFSWTLTFMALTAKLELQGNALRNGCDLKAIHEIANNCREIQLQTLLFNYVNATSLFVLKQLIHFGAVTFIFMALNWFQKSWTESAIILGIGCQLITIYVLYFGRAFEIPEKARDVKKNILIAARRDLRGEILAKKAIAIPYIGIRIGIFKYFGKESTLLFCSFVVDQVINLLISFR
ncbi:unnamed protein product [Allacma fusca]|uniref:Uncharacterized protein n=1 Tax=Allacma fusca TaxID=39272 RepID=A0A8J2LSI7_9HEXA|nr:unnamed protein product [Allacma fusca]